jgi:hypothetical protein
MRAAAIEVRCAGPAHSIGVRMGYIGRRRRKLSRAGAEPGVLHALRWRRRSEDGKKTGGLPFASTSSGPGTAAVSEWFS